MSDVNFEEPNAAIEPAGVYDAAPADEPAGGPIGPTFDLSIYVEPQGIACQFQCEGYRQEWKMPRTVVRRAHKAVTIDNVFDFLGAGPIIGYFLRDAVTNEPEYQLVPRAVNSLTDRVTKALRQVQKITQKVAKAAEEPAPLACEKAP